jgi:hypothetical protein
MALLFEILLFFYTLFVIPYHKLKNAYKRYFLCELCIEKERLVVVIGKEKMITNYRRCSPGTGYQYQGEWFSNSEKEPEPVELPDDF